VIHLDRPNVTPKGRSREEGRETDEQSISTAIASQHGRVMKC